jgi:cytoskeletal protein CcmA (bactofilin family)
VVGDIEHESLAIEKGAYFEGRSVMRSPEPQPLSKFEKPSTERLTERLRRRVPNEREPAAAPAE